MQAKQCTHQLIYTLSGKQHYIRTCIALRFTAQSSNALCMCFVSQSSAVAVLLLPKLVALVALTVFMGASWTLLYSSPTEARKPHTMMGSDSSLRPLEEAAAAALPPKAEEAAAAVADPTSPPYSPPEVAAAAALASPWLKPCDLAYNIKTAVENITWHEACTVWQQCGELQMKSMGACKEGNRRKCLVAVKSYKQAACRRGRP